MEIEKLPRAGYSPEFREQAVRTYQESGLSVSEVAKIIAESLGDGGEEEEMASIGKNQKAISELEMGLSRLKRELAEIKMERDFLKKCSAYFAKGSQ